jgi:hypothetical protein
LRTPAADSQSQRQGDIEAGPVHAGLATADNLLPDQRSWFSRAA